MSNDNVYAVVNQDNLVTNIIIWDGVTPVTIKDGGTLILVAEEQVAYIDGTYVDGQFLPAPLEPEVDPPVEG